jgi:hypothetical protein
MTQTQTTPAASIPADVDVLATFPIEGEESAWLIVAAFDGRQGLVYDTERGIDLVASFDTAAEAVADALNRAGWMPYPSSR